jgi:2-dehydropantoate 2-reductase
MHDLKGENMKIVIYGAGSIGGSTGAWIAEKYDNIYLLARGEHYKAMKEKGLTIRQGDNSGSQKNIRVKVIGNIGEAPDADVVAIAVKNYSLEEAAKNIKNFLGDKPIIIGMQNGLENQVILPEYFSKVIYCVISYNAWLNQPGEIYYQSKGPLVLGTLHGELQEEMKAIAAIFNMGLKTEIAVNFQDAAHSKLIINLINCFVTLIGYKFKEIDKPELLQKVFMNILLEGIRIIKASGFKEYKIQGLPSWGAVRMGAKLPQFISGKWFRDNMKKTFISSMAQDIIQRGKHDSELEYLNGYLLNLADQCGIRAPYNRTIYELGKIEFAKPVFTPLSLTEVWQKISKNLQSS